MNKYKVTKIGRVEKPYHDNSTFGESKPFHVGLFVREPIVGQRFNLLTTMGYMGISTSPVVKIVDKNTFETLNSIYRYEKFKTD